LPDIELRSASLEIRHTKLIGNEATGGDGNSLVALPIPTPQIHRPAGAFGAGVNVYQGTADISKSVIANNVSRAGESGDAGGAGVAFFGFVGTVEASLSNSLVMNNLAYSEDGESLGAGISSGALGSLFAVRNGSAVVTASISRVLIFGNRAEAGEGGRAFGGGIYNDSESDLTLERSKVFKNQAVAGPGGEGIGGGIYSQVAVDLIHSKVFKNFASTSDDDCFGC